MANVQRQDRKTVAFSTRRLLGVLGLGFALTQATPASAINVSWDDEGGSANKLWSNFGNWSPDGDVQNDDVFIGNFAAAANDTTLLDSAKSIASLTLSNGADVVNSSDNGATNDFELIVNGPTIIGGAGTTFFVIGADADGLDTDTLTLNSGGTLNLNSTTVQGTAVTEVDNGLLDVNVGGTIIGTGRIDLSTSAAAATTLLSNDGIITANRAPFFFGQAPIADSLQIRAEGTGAANADFDWDGTGGTGILQANGNQTLDIDVDVSGDAFSGTMNLNTGSTIDIQSAWSLNTGTINANTGAFGLIIIGQDPNPGPGAHIDGGNWSMSGGTIEIADTWDTLILDSQVTASGGVVNNNGVLEVNGGASFFSGVDFNMLGAGASLVVNSALNIDTPDFDLDASGTNTNVTTINGGGNLDLDLGAGADLGFNHVINMNGSDNGLNSAELDITSSTATAFTLVSNGEMNIAGGGTSRINSTETFNASGDIDVTGAGTFFDVNPATAYVASTTVTVGAGAIYNQDGAATYNGGSYTGAGEFRPGTSTIETNTTWAVDTVDFDDGPTTINNGATLTVNTDDFETGSDGIDGTTTIQDTGVLQFNLAGGGDVLFDGDLVYNGNIISSTFLAAPTTGSALRFQGASADLTINGDGTSDAKIEIGSGARLNINDAAEDFRMNGGTLAVGNTNLIEGGTINGPGELQIATGRALRGFGSIDAQVDGDSSAQLIAQGGTLNVTEGIEDIGTIGTVTGGTLNVQDTWNTNVTNTVLLQGGTISGSTITNDGAAGINGRGLVTANINNNTRIDAEGGTLTIDSAFNVIDWDGTGNNGSLNALTGNLTVRDNAIFVFNGTVQANAGRTFLADGFELRPGAGSNLILNGGVFRSTNPTAFFGSGTVGAGPASRIETGSLSNFNSTVSFTLNGDLLLDSSTTRIQSGAFFGGGAGDLIHLNGGLLQLDDGAAVSTVLENRGRLTLASGSGRGSATVQDFEQTATGEFNLDIIGTGLGDFDRLSVNGSVFLDGELDVDFVGGFAPTAGDTFAFMTHLATNGTFSSLDVTGLAAGLGAVVNYTPTATILEIINALVIEGDYNADGFVSQGDLDLVLLNWGDAVVPAGFDEAAIPGGGPFDGLMSQNELDGVLLNWGNGTPPLVAIPEPATGLLLALGALGVTRRRREA